MAITTEWPTTIPAPLRDMTNISQGSTIESSKRQSGRIEQRRFGSGAPDVLMAQLRLTTTQYAAWKTFYKTTINLGTQWWIADWLEELGYTDHAGLLVGYLKRGHRDGYVDIAIKVLIQDQGNIVVAGDWE